MYAFFWWYTKAKPKHCILANTDYLKIQTNSSKIIWESVILLQKSLLRYWNVWIISPESSVLEVEPDDLWGWSLPWKNTTKIFKSFMTLTMTTNNILVIDVTRILVFTPLSFHDWWTGFLYFHNSGNLLFTEIWNA